MSNSVQEEYQAILAQIQSITTGHNDPKLSQLLSSLDTLLQLKCFPILTRLASLKLAAQTTTSTNTTKSPDRIEVRLKQLDMGEFESILNEIDVAETTESVQTNTDTKTKN